MHCKKKHSYDHMKYLFKMIIIIIILIRLVKAGKAIQLINHLQNMKVKIACNNN